MKRNIILSTIAFMLASTLFSSCGNTSTPKEENKHNDTHEHNYVITHISPTCEEDGYTLHQCSCGESFKDEFSTKLGHDLEHKHDLEFHFDECKVCNKIFNKESHHFISEVTAPTCTTEGYTTFKCECGYSYKGNYINELGHEYIQKHDEHSHWNECENCDEKFNIESHHFVSETIEPTCTADGYTLYSCECGYSYKDNYIEKLNHNLCNKHDEKQHWQECSVCKEKFLIENHTFIHQVIEPTCEHEGSDIYSCTCGYSYSVKTGDSLEHEIEITYDDNYHYESCSNCDYVKKDSHTLQKTVVKPTCTEEGYTKYECACGYERIEDRIPALTHDYHLNFNEEHHYLECSRCSDIIEENSHDFVPKTIEPTCTEGGYTLYSCECGYSYKDKYTDETGHNYVDKYDDQYHYRECQDCFDVIEKEEHVYTDELIQPTCYEKGYTLHSCDCGYSYKDNYTDQLTHDYVVKYDEKEHWKQCSHCGDVFEKESHDFSPMVVNPTCEENGYTEFVCECGYSYCADEVKAKGHKTEKLPAVEATKTSTGLTEGEWCTECKKILVEQKITYYLDVSTKGTKAGDVQFKSHSVVAGETVTLKVATSPYFFGYKIGNSFVSKELTYSFEMPSSNVSVVAVYSEYPNCDIWDGSIASKFASGDGSKSSPYLITTGAELAYLAKIVNNNNTVFDGYYKLMKNIDLQCLPWTPIGNLLNKDTLSKYNFEGHFDGNNFNIYNLEITNDDSSLFKGYVGLFGYVGKNAEILNLGIGDSAIDITEVTGSSYYVGLLAGYFGTYTTISNCFVKSSTIYIDGYTSSSYKTYIGGMFGYVDKHTTISNCEVNNEIIVELGDCSTTFIGGLSAYTDEYTLVTQVTSNGKITADNKPTKSTYGTLTVGGLFGYLGSYYNKTKLVNYSEIEITNTFDVIVGGLIGSFGDSNALTELIESDNHGSIIINGCRALTCGGLVAKSVRAKATSCYNVGAINCYNVAGKAYVGGVAGDSFTAFCCYQSANISVEFVSDSTAYIGGLIGDSGTCEECYATGTYNVKNTYRKYSSICLNGISNSPSEINKCFSSVNLCLTIETLTIKEGSPQFPSSLYLGYLCGYNSRLLNEGNGSTDSSCNVNGYSFLNKDSAYIDGTIIGPRDIDFDKTYWSWQDGVLFPILVRS